jgi:ubiquinone/menaquinone biosynthesis C-methylase UbiE
MTDRNAEFTGSVPAAYDRFLGPMLFAPFADDLTARLTASPATAVLELACGTGILTARLRRALPAAATLTATDLNEPMLAYARTEVLDARIAWQPADAQDLPFPDGAFDAVACQFGLMFVPDKARAFSEARRVLRTRGRFAFNVWLSHVEHGHPHRPDTIARYFTSNPPTFYDVPSGFHDESLIRQLLQATHFEVVSLERVTLEAHSPSAHAAAQGLVLGNPIVLDIQERATAPVEEIISAVAAGLTAAGGTAPLRLPMGALVVLARAV